MFAYLGAILFTPIIVITIGVMLGLPFGEFTMGGRHRIVPKNLRYLSAITLFIQLFSVMIVIQSGGIIPLLFSPNTTNVICIILASFLSLNVVMNVISKSRKERYIMTPLSLLIAICFWFTAFN